MKNLMIKRFAQSRRLAALVSVSSTLVVALTLSACGGSGGGGGAVMPEPPPLACAAQPLTWTVGGNTCSGVGVETASGSVASIVASVGANTGTAAFACTNGSFGAAAAGATCNARPVEPLTNCAAQTLTWSVSGNTCSGAGAAAVSGAVSNVTATVGANTGTAAFTCTNGSFGAAAAASCTPRICDGKGC
jgi:hypothetical protein